MVHDTPSGKSARKLKTEAQVLLAEALVLAEIAGLEQEVQEREAKSAGLREKASELKRRARLEDLTIRQEALIKQTMKGEKRTYYRWVASWREGSRYRKAYLGNCRKMSQGEALQKARRMKAEAIGLDAKD